MKNVFPSHSLPLKEKNSNWILEMAKAIWEEWDTQSIKSFNKGADRYNLNKLYAIGKNPNDKYKPMFEISDDENSSYVNLDFSVPAIIPKFKRIVNNRHSKIDFVINAQAIDSYALEDKLDYEAREKANIEMRKMLSELGLPDDVLNSGEVDQPLEEEELSIKMEFGYKHNMAIDVEKKIDAVFTESRVKDSLTVVRDRLFDSGVAGFKVSTDKKSGRVSVRVVDPNNLVVSPTMDPFFRDIWYAGEAILMTIDEIRRSMVACGKDFKEDELEELADKNLGKFSNPNKRGYKGGVTGAYSYDHIKVPVFHGEFMSSNKTWYEKRITKRGNPIIGKIDEPKKKQDREYFDDSDIVIFEFKWIIDTNIVFEDGLKPDVYRKEPDLWNTRLSYLLVAPELNSMETNPMIEQMIPVVDQIILAWYKLQNVIAKARPKGILIEIGALEHISLGDGGDGDMTPLSILDMFTQTGVLVYRKIGLDGSQSNYKPIEELANGLGDEAAGYFAVIDKYMSYLGGMIGMNEVTDGSTPDPRLLNGVAGLANDATSNALHHLLIAERYLVETVADEVAVRVHDSMTFKKDSIYRNIVAPNSVKSIKENKGALHRVYGIAIEYDADQQEKQLLQQKIQIAIERDQITLADAVRIERTRNLKQAEQLLAFRIKKNQELKMQMAEADKASNAEASIAAARAAEEEKRKTLQAEIMLKSELAKLEAQLEMEKMEFEYSLRTKEVGATNQGKKEVEEIRVDGAAQTAQIKSQGKSNS